MKESLHSAETNDLAGNFAHRNMGLSGRATYAFDSGISLSSIWIHCSERFSKNERFGFPSIGVGWMASNESSGMKN